MIPRPGNSRPYNSRLDNLISWFAASIIVTAGVIYGLKLQEDRGKSKPERALARATPAQEPLTWQERRAAERGRGRRAHAPLRIPWRGWKDILVRSYHQIQNDRLLALAAALGVECTAFTTAPADREPPGRGRPRKEATEQPAEPPAKRPRGRPRKESGQAEG